MRAGLVCAVVVASACKSGGGDGTGSGAVPTPSKHPDVATVDVASVLAADDGPPPLLVIVDDARELVEHERVLDTAVKVNQPATGSGLAKTRPNRGAESWSQGLPDQVGPH